MLIHVLLSLSHSFGAQSACEETYVDAQRHQRDGRLLEARVALVRCAQRDCPRIAQTDCARWLAEVEARLPTIVVRAQDPDGHDLAGTIVFVDGERIESEGRAIDLDPGTHELRVEAPGSLPRTQEITTFEGEKNRRIDLALMPAEPAPAKVAKSGPPLWIYLAGGSGLVGMGSFAYFATASTHQFKQLEQECAPRCADSDVASIARKQVIADVSLGAGIAGIGSALVGLLIYVLSERDTPVTMVLNRGSMTSGTEDVSVGLSVPIR